MKWTEEFLSLFVFRFFFPLSQSVSFILLLKSDQRVIEIAKNHGIFYRMDDTVFIFFSSVVHPSFSSSFFLSLSLNSIDCINDYAIIFHFIAFHFSSTFSAHGELDVIDLPRILLCFNTHTIHMLPCPIK